MRDVVHKTVLIFVESFNYLIAGVLCAWVIFVISMHGLNKLSCS